MTVRKGYVPAAGETDAKRLADAIRQLYQNAGGDFPALYNVKDYRAVGDGATDDTAAIQRAFDAAEAAGGGIVFVPPGKYAVSTLDFTACVVGIEIVGVGPPGGTASGLSVIKPILQASSKPGIDCTGSSYLAFRNIQVYAYTSSESTAPSVKPTAGFLLASSAGTLNSNKNLLENCGTNGFFTTAAVGLASTVNNLFVGGQYINQQTDAPTIYAGRAQGKTWNTVHPSGVNTTNNFCNESTFLGVEAHARYLDLTATAPTIELIDANTFEFYGQVISNSGTGAYINVSGSCAGCKIRPGKFYSEGGGTPSYVLHAESSAALTDWEIFSYVNPGNGPSIVGFSGESGATVANSFLMGFASAHYSGNLVASFIAPDAAWVAWTPAVTASSGTITTASASGRYKQIGKTVTFHITITVTTNGTGAGALVFQLPLAAATRATFAGRERALTGKMVQVICDGSGGTGVTAYYYDNSYPGANGAVLEIAGAYETT